MGQAMGSGPLRRLIIMLRGEALVLAGVVLKLGAALLVVQMLMWIQSAIPDSQAPSSLAMVGHSEKPDGVASGPLRSAGRARRAH